MRAGDMAEPTEADGVTAPIAAGTGHVPEPTLGDALAAGADDPGPVRRTSAAQTDATGNWTSGADGLAGTVDGHGPMPDRARAPPVATSATTRSRRSSAAGAWGSSTRPGRSASTGLSPSR